MDHLVQSAAQLSAHLRSLRLSQGLTQAQLGALVGLHQSRIAKIEHDPRVVSVGQLVRILSALGMQLVLRPRAKPAGARSAHDTADW